MAVRQRKKQKVVGEGENPYPVLRHLVKTKLSLEEATSPGAVHSRRVAVQGGSEGLSDVAVYFATGRHVFHVKATLDNLPAAEQGKEGVFIPTIWSDSTARCIPQVSHEAEVQHLELLETADSVLLGSIDAYGRALISHFPGSCGSSDVPAASHSYALTPPYPECREGGWAGITFSPLQPDFSATARQFARAVSVHHKQDVLHNLHTIGYPTALQLLPLAGCHILAVGEGHQVTIWDVRAGGASGGGCVQRVNVSVPGFTVYSLAWCDLPGAGLLGAAGSDRSVSMLDPRKWRVLTKWGGCSKGSIWHLSFSSLDPHYCTVAGLDQEVVVGRWDAAPGRSMFQNHGNHAQGLMQTVATATATPAAPAAAVSATAPVATRSGGLQEEGGEAGSIQQGSISFRGDSRWLGVAKSMVSDVLAGFGASNNLFVATFGNELSDVTA